MTNSNDRFDTEIKDDFVSLKKKNPIFSDTFKKISVAIILICSICILTFFVYLYNNNYYNSSIIESTFAEYCYYVIDTKLNLKSENNILNLYGDYSYDYVPSRIEDFNYMTECLEETKNFIYVIKDKNDNIVYSNLENNPHISIRRKIMDNGQFLYIYRQNNVAGSIVQELKTTCVPTLELVEKTSEISEVPITGLSLGSTEYVDPVEFLKNQNIYTSFINGKSTRNLYGYYDHFVISYHLDEIDAKDYKIYCAVIEPMYEDVNDIFYQLQTQSNNMQNIFHFCYIFIAVLSLIIATLTLSLIYTAGQSHKGSDVILMPIDNISIGMQSFILMVIAFFEFIILSIFEIYTQVIAYILLPATILLVLSYLCSFSRQFKAKILFKNNSAKKIYFRIKDFCSNYNFPVILLSISFLIILNGFWYIFLFCSELEFEDFPIILIFIFTIVLDFIFLLWLLRFMLNFQKLKKLANEISIGNIETDIDCSKMDSNTKTLAQDIKNIQNGLSSAIDKAIKGERLKTELITNVSHDLKTPLTSIINYVDLLKKENIQNPKANEYIQILDDKSARLKQLIDDLVEASKASSGNISIEFQKIDLYQLIQQACGEYEEKLSKNNLEIKINCSESIVFVKGDSRHMWRIVENLLSNISKYAMPNSRVYIDITHDLFNGILTIKNISAEPLDISPEQLTERFVRGDVSRTTEGSGLGLSIAQSLTEVQKGNFKLNIDGDLFKVSVEIPLYEN